MRHTTAGHLRPADSAQVGVCIPDGNAGPCWGGVPAHTATVKLSDLPGPTQKCLGWVMGRSVV